MKTTAPDSQILDSLTLQELCRFCRAEESWVVELVQQGVLEPEGTGAANWRFHGLSITRAKKARRLSCDLGINAVGVALVLDLLEQREYLLRRLGRYENL
ncbi:chaperone modulator CbpM [Leisingera aquaemixtae]|uniref:Chaperone-modulator protein CbpM n=1 Tax=Leisingera aquaemixtae TaxID=1396826 RepID=A0A0P1HEJ2_9RHOB|nr:chaperone modulator CbpM [Leisingera aquaemixtae]CUI02185.1 chaperone-modulator protein CbpM [Leisingera aquaemixtae]